jgi:hypothetical protein
MTPVPGTEHYRQIAAQKREVAQSCQFAYTRKEIIHLAGRLESRADHLDRRAGSMNGARLVSLILAIAVTLTAYPLFAREHRSREVTREFQREHPCPSTGRTGGACPDHVIPLACGGPDAVANLQWQTVRDAKAKNQWERKGCTR